MSVDMFHHMLDKNSQTQDGFERWNLNLKEHREFISELIMGEPGEYSSKVSILLYYAITALHSFLFYCYVYIHILMYV